jgi:hypothetical protein
MTRTTHFVLWFLPQTPALSLSIRRTGTCGNGISSFRVILPDCFTKDRRYRGKIAAPSGARLAEAGCSGNEILAISGHTTMKELVRYTAAADQAQLARNALAKAVIR